jgi:hypothetical protein
MAMRSNQNYGSIKFVSGPLSGQQVSGQARRRLHRARRWLGADRDRRSANLETAFVDWREGGRVVIEDQNSRNGTFVNDPKSARVTETSLNAGDTVILGESDVARFEFHSN